jgi:hypothetical protein
MTKKYEKLIIHDEVVRLQATEGDSMLAVHDNVGTESTWWPLHEQQDHISDLMPTAAHPTRWPFFAIVPAAYSMPFSRLRTGKHS